MLVLTGFHATIQQTPHQPNAARDTSPSALRWQVLDFMQLSSKCHTNQNAQGRLALHLMLLLA
jgi:hypothetical protein